MNFYDNQIFDVIDDFEKVQLQIIQKLNQMKSKLSFIEDRLLNIEIERQTEKEKHLTPRQKSNRIYYLKNKEKYKKKDEFVLSDNENDLEDDG